MTLPFGNFNHFLKVTCGVQFPLVTRDDRINVTLFYNLHAGIVQYAYQLKPKKGNLMFTLSKMYPNYEATFSVKSIKFNKKKEWRNIFLITKAGTKNGDEG